MTPLHGATALVTGGAGTIGSTVVDQFLEAGVGGGPRARQPRPGTPGEPARGAGRPPDPPGRRRHPRPRSGPRPHRGAPTWCSTWRRSASPSAPRNPDWPTRCSSTARSTSSRPRPTHRVGKIIASSSASVYGLAEEFPTTERHHPWNNDTFYGWAKVMNEGMLRSFRAMHGLDYVALRYFNVYGPRMDIHGLYTEVLIRWMQRIAAGQPPLIFGDGAQTMDFVFTTDIARANLLAAASRMNEGVYNIASGQETCLPDLAEALLRTMGSDLPHRIRPGAPGQRGDPAAGFDIDAARRDLDWTADIDLDDGLRRPRRLVAGRARDRRRARAESRADRERINVMQPWLGEEEIAAVTEVLRSGWVAQGPRVSGLRRGLRRPPAGPARGGAVRRARRRCTWHCISPGSGPRRGRRAVVLVHRHDQRGALRRGRPGVRRRRRRHRQPDRRHRGSRTSTAAPAPSSGSTRAASRSISTHSGAVRPARRPGARGRRLRRGIHLPRTSGGRRRRDRRLVVPPAQAAHHRRRRDAHHHRGPTGPSGRGGCASTP